MKKRGISILGIIVFIGLVALIVWGLNYIVTQDHVTIRTSDFTLPNNTSSTSSSTPDQNVAPIVSVATSTPTSTAVSTPTTVTSTNSQPTTSDQDGLTVTFDGKKFSPASLTVIKGQSVTFVNNSSSSLWVAANPFPSSSDYPAFNEKAGIASGASWSFTFTKTGTWFYHNHYSPAQGAKIVVNAK